MKRIALVHNTPQYTKNFVTNLNTIQKPNKTVSYEGLFFEDIFLDISPKNISMKFGSLDPFLFDAAFIRKTPGGSLRSLPKIFAYALEQKRIPVTGIPETVYYEDKLFQTTLFQKQNILFPRTIFCNRSKIADNLDKIPLRYPIVMKNLTGSKGEDNYLVASKQDILTILEKDNQRTNYIFQEFISNDCDYRIVVINHKLSHIVKRTRTNKTDHRNNVSQGALAERVDENEIPAGLVEISIELSYKISSPVIGTDIIISNQDSNPYWLEINSVPLLSNKTDIYPGYRLLHEYLNNLTK